MKKFLFLFILLFSISDFYGQEIYGKYGQWENADSSSYILIERNDVDRFEVQNKRNSLYLEEYKPSEKLKADHRVLLTSIPKLTFLPDLVKEVWNKERIFELAGRETVRLRIYMSDSGEFKEIGFYLKPETEITPLEINSFEQKLKNISLELKNEDLKGSNYISLDCLVNFYQIAEKMK